MSAPLVSARYTLLNLIGRGGEAEVWQAHDLETKTDVAVRLPLKPILTPLTFSLPLPHPGWVPYLTTGFDFQRGCYQVFAIITGPTLGELVSVQPLPWENWLTFLTQSLAAVAALHRIGWVHGDLQEANFIYEQKTQRWILLELPFLAFPVPGRSPLFGRLPLLAPELFQGQAASYRSDLYALGSLFYYALTGAYPHQGSAVEIAAAHLHEVIPSLKIQDPRITSELDGWLQCLLERAPEKRFSEAQAAHDMLISCIAHSR